MNNDNNFKSRKKLIEVAIPLNEINAASVREKSLRHGHPSTLHLWWARRPLATARAVIFSQMVDDPSEHPDEFPTEKEQIEERQRLFRIIKELVKWENTTNEDLFNQAQDEIWKSWQSTCADNKDHPRAAELFDPDKLPGFHDPFAGGGALPLEAQRLGLDAHASDLNPVAVLINKAMIEIPSKFAGVSPVNPDTRKGNTLFNKEWSGPHGLAEDVRYYGWWMRDEAEKQFGDIYPKINVTEEMTKERPDLKEYVGSKLTVIAWLWARTVKSPNPAFSHVDVPLVNSFMLSNRPGNEAYINPIFEKDNYHFKVKIGKPTDSEDVKRGVKVGKGNFRCIMSNTPIIGNYIRTEAQAKRIGHRLLAIVAEGNRGRVYLSPTFEHEVKGTEAKPKWKPELEIADGPYMGVKGYGMNSFDEIFSDRQLFGLTTFSDLVTDAREIVKRDAIAAGMTDDGIGLDAGGVRATAYAEAVSLYLTFVVSKCSDYWSSISTWSVVREGIRGTFGRQFIPMVWDYAETNPLSNSSGNFIAMLDWVRKAIIGSRTTSKIGVAKIDDALTQSFSLNKVVSTDPPYYDNVPYADLSDFFYIWMRRSLKDVFPTLFNTIATPKDKELVAFAHKHKNKTDSDMFFLDGMTKALIRINKQMHPAFPITAYYAFKQTETNSSGGVVSTGWQSFLESIVQAGFAISGTWPMRTELSNRMRANESNALASSIVLVCRKRFETSPTATRREFVTSLQSELPVALFHLRSANIAPVDLAQSVIGPGMMIYTRYSRVLDASGEPMSVRDALALINQTLDEVLTEQESELDADTRWAMTWFEQQGFSEGDYGVAETLSKSRNTSIDGMLRAGILKSGRGKVCLLRPEELPDDWDPLTDTRTPTWEVLHQLVRALKTYGENAASDIVSKIGPGNSELARELAYKLYVICERKKWANEALSYNALVQSWPEISSIVRKSSADQQSLF